MRSCTLAERSDQTGFQRRALELEWIRLARRPQCRQRLCTPALCTPRATRETKESLEAVICGPEGDISEARQMLLICKQMVAWLTKCSHYVYVPVAQRPTCLPETVGTARRHVRGIMPQLFADGNGSFEVDGSMVKIARNEDRLARMDGAVSQHLRQAWLGL